MPSFLITVLLSLTGLAFASAAEAQEPVNTTCPIMEDEPIDPEYTVEHRGLKVGLCCEACHKRWNKDPEKYIARDELLTQAFAALDAVDSGADESAEALDPASSLQPVGRGTEGMQEEIEDAIEDIKDRLPRLPQDPAETEVSTSEQIGRLHPLSVHFPIALLLLAALMELLVALGMTGLSPGARLVHWLATISVGVSTWLGLSLEDLVSYRGRMAEVVEDHELFGLITAGLAITSLIVGEIGRRKKAPSWAKISYRPLLWAAGLFVIWVGHLGGQLVFGEDYLPF